MMGSGQARAHRSGSSGRAPSSEGLGEPSEEAALVHVKPIVGPFILLDLNPMSFIFHSW